MDPLWPSMTPNLPLGIDGKGTTVVIVSDPEPLKVDCCLESRLGVAKESAQVSPYEWWGSGRHGFSDPDL
jgi:hypothetical protein